MSVSEQMAIGEYRMLLSIEKSNDKEKGAADNFFTSLPKEIQRKLQTQADIFKSLASMDGQLRPILVWDSKPRFRGVFLIQFMKDHGFPDETEIISIPDGAICFLEEDRQNPGWFADPNALRLVCEVKDQATCISLVVFIESFLQQGLGGYEDDFEIEAKLRKGFNFAKTKITAELQRGQRNCDVRSFIVWPDQIKEV